MVQGPWAPGSEEGGSCGPEQSLREEAAGTRTPCSGVVKPLPLITLNTSHSPTSEPGQPDTPGMRSRSLGRALACPARSEHSRKQPQGPRAWAGGDPGVQASPTSAAFSRGTGGGDVISSSCFTCPSSLLPPSASHPSKAVTCTGKREEPLWRWARHLFQGTLGFQRLWKGWLFFGGGRSRPSPICLCNWFPSSRRWLPPPSPEMSGRRLPVSYTGAPHSLGAPSPRVRRWRCC